jgi:hypothetical protein
MGHPRPGSVCQDRGVIMLYRNVKTGCEFESNCICKGADLELVEDKEKAAEKKTQPATKRKAVKK